MNIQTSVHSFLDDGLSSPSPSCASKLEFFMRSDFEMLPDFTLYTALNELHVINCSLNNLDNLHTAPLLNKLFLIETSISDLSNFPKLLNLTHLFLYSNHITSIPPSFPVLTSLQHLDLSNNSLTSITNLIPLIPNITSLNVAQNNITDFSTLSTLAHLEDLNIAGNPFHHLFTIRKFHIPSLSSLSFSHLLFSPAPVCYSVNYRLGVIGIFPKLSYLDGRKVEEQEVIDAEATTLKKYGYYSNRVQKISNFFQGLINEASIKISKVIHDLELNHSVSTRIKFENCLTFEDSSREESTISEINSDYHYYQQLLQHYRKSLENCLKFELVLQWIEFDSCGNLKFDWDCSFLVKLGLDTSLLSRSSLFCCRSCFISMHPFKQNEIISRNLKFSILTNSTLGHFSLSDCIFGPIDEHNVDLYDWSSLIKNVYRQIQKFKGLLPVVITVGVIYQSTLIGLLDLTDHDCSSKSHEGQKSTSIVASLLRDHFHSKLNSVQSDPMNDDSRKFSQSQIYTNTNLKNLGGSLNMVKILKLELCFGNVKNLDFLTAFPNVEFVDVSYNEISRIKFPSFFPKLTTLILIKNLVSTLDSISSDCKQYVPELTCLDLRQNSVCSSSKINYLLINKFKNLKYFNLLPVVSDRNENDDLIVASTYILCQSAKLELLHSESLHFSNFTNINCSNVVELILDNQRLTCESLHFLINFKSLKVLSLNDNLLDTFKFLAFLPNVSFLESLSLNQNLFSNFGVLSQFSLNFMYFLSLSHNYIKNFDTFPPLGELRFLNLSHNPINSLDNIEKSPKISHLFLSFTCINDISPFRPLRRLQKLSIFDVSSSPVVEDPEFFYSTLFSLKKLKALNGQLITHENRTQASSMFTGRLTREILVRKVCKFNRNQSFKRNSQEIASLDLSGLGLRQLHAFTVTSITEVPIFENLKCLSLDHNCLKSTDDLVNIAFRVPVLKCLSLVCNKFTTPSSLSGLASIQSLTELDLSDCQIPTINYIPLNRLSSLQKLIVANNCFSSIDSGFFGSSKLYYLDLSRNNIVSINVNAFSNSNITHLYLNDNSIRTLSALCVASLISLELSNNRISDSYEISRIANFCSKLKYLDLHGCPIARKNLFRDVCISTLPHLNVLNRMPITSDERLKASRSDSCSLPAIPNNDCSVKVPLKISTFNFDHLGNAASRFQFHS
ncbi:hypothetical protein GEMRC1_001600 [Eukaryota sp. GEM-RC1]